MPPEPIYVNRPPAIDLVNVQPSAPVVQLYLDCPEQTDLFTVRFIELDTDQLLSVRWFLDYDVSGQNGAGFLQQRLVDPNGTVWRSDDFDPADLVGEFSSPGVYVLEAFVVEVDALTGDDTDVPLFRATKDCAASGYPDDCISTHPASYRWVLDVRDEQCL
ncbi:MAG: hypothetical protein P1V51_06285 [Deltaproteobacteria bacterium]|nr:hypothetical protein [Deltaproteobacteria bacterium]